MPSVKGMNGSGLVEAIEIGLVSADVKEWMIVAHKDAAGVSTEAEFGVVVKIVQVDWHGEVLGYWVERFGFNNSSAITCLFKFSFLHGCKKNMSITVLKALHHRLCKLEVKYLGMEVMEVDDSSDEEDTSFMWWDYVHDRYTDSNDLDGLELILKNVDDFYWNIYLFLRQGDWTDKLSQTINGKNYELIIQRKQDRKISLTISCSELSKYKLHIEASAMEILRVEAFESVQGHDTPVVHGYNGMFYKTKFEHGIKTT